MADIKQLLLESKDAAAVLAISERTLWDLAARGEIRRVRIGRLVRFSVAELEAWVARQNAAAGALQFPGQGDAPDKAAM
jgi:excisionase family DNA binding protein